MTTQDQPPQNTALYRDSSLREKVIEHVFVGELLRVLWRNGRYDIEVLRAEVDRGGYDLVIECNGVLRHIQFKSSHRASKVTDVGVHLRLADKPSGCVMWVLFDQDTMELGPYLWLGGLPSERLPALGDKIARHSKGDSFGRKAERPNHRVVRRSRFSRLESMAAVVTALFGIAAERPEIRQSVTSASDSCT